ncbi:MAG: GNAT family N-acetyltransferase [Pseudomonadota bacterium]
MNDTEIIAYSPDWEARLRALTRAAWAPAMAGMRQDYPGFVWQAFYPEGWEARLDTDILAFVAREDATVWIARRGEDLLGFAGILLHPEDRMGEVHVLAVAPAAQRSGLARRLMARAEAGIAGAGMEMVMVETGGDRGHAPARAFYQAAGYVQAPVARYFKPL